MGGLPYSTFTHYAPTTVRIGMSLVFFLFAFKQLQDPTNFIGYLPEFIYMAFLDNMQFLETLIIINAISEIILGAFLLAGLYTRIAAFLLAVHLAAITLSLGFTLDGIRDFGLTCATISIWLHGPDSLSLDKKWRKL
ncbi:MAG: DoxX family membrane protein [Candidatus Woesearchaeota archaeon]